MKKSHLRIATALIMAATVAFSLTSCLKDDCISETEYVAYQPVYKTSEELRTDISVQASRELQNPGNINYFNGFMFVNEVLEGVHIIDNRDPHNPINLAFVDIPGSRDMATKDGILYIDSYLDLLAIDITTPSDPKLVHREEDVFQSYIPQNAEFQYLVSYEPTDVREVVDCSNPSFSRGWFWQDDILFARGTNIDVFTDALINAPTGSIAIGNTIDFNGGSVGFGGVGTGGSLARFTIAKNHLYALDQFQMQVFNVQQAITAATNKVQLQNRIETIFPFGENLFIGTDLGLQIFSIADATTPVFLSEFEHAQACDPVFATEDFAYVTLRDGSICANAQNQLDVVDIQNLTNPKLVKSYSMTNPHGLSVTGDRLFLCDGRAGLKVFDIKNKERITDNQLSHLSTLDAKDVIVLPPGNLVMVIGEDGFYQFDATDPTQLKQISVLPIVRDR